MELDEETKKSIKESVAPIITSLGTAALVAAAVGVVKAITVTNYKRSDLTGDKEMHPTKDEANISAVETSAKDTDASLAKDEVKAKDGDLSAVSTDAAAADTEATALEGGAAAARTKAGAADIETKGLKMT